MMAEGCWAGMFIEGDLFGIFIGTWSVQVIIEGNWVEATPEGWVGIFIMGDWVGMFHEICWVEVFIAGEAGTKIQEVHPMMV